MDGKAATQADAADASGLSMHTVTSESMEEYQRLDDSRASINAPAGPPVDSAEEVEVTTSSMVYNLVNTILGAGTLCIPYALPTHTHKVYAHI